MQIRRIICICPYQGRYHHLMPMSILHSVQISRPFNFLSFSHYNVHFLICNLVVLYFFYRCCYSECHLLTCLSSFCIFVASILLPLQQGIYVGNLNSLLRLGLKSEHFFYSDTPFTLQAKCLRNINLENLLVKKVPIILLWNCFIRPIIFRDLFLSNSVSCPSIFILP